jgi:hypothetical protein
MLVRPFACGAILLGIPLVASAAERPVVVELFSSEGCSSCPPAETFLTELSRQRHDVLPLAFHVTYWNALGWKDPYSLEAATRRQAVYGARFGDGSYTPEMVVDGREGLVGSDRERAIEAIEAAKRDFTAAKVEARREGNVVSIVVGPGAGTAKLMLVGYDPQHRTSIGRGENAGRTLIESDIVRSIQSIGEWNGGLKTFHVEASAGFRQAVLLEAGDGSIVGAARVSDTP